MPSIPLFSAWTWKLGLPAPFDTVADNKSTTHCSVHNTQSPRRSTLHGPVLSAILAYMDMDTSITSSPAAEHALGTQGDLTAAEYHSRTKEIHTVCFNKKNGKFNCNRYDSITSSPKGYTVKESENTGTALFFVLIPEAMTDGEFKEHYDILSKCKQDGFIDMPTAEESAFILCDNLYRRIQNAASVGNAKISLSMQNTGNLPAMTQLNLKKGAYSPTSTLFGTFQILTAPPSAKVSTLTDKNDFVNKYLLSARTFTPNEQLLIPSVEDWYVIPQEIVSICKHAQLTTGGIQPMRNFMMRGPAGTGKTEGAKAIAAGLGLPYMYYTCSANTEIYDFLGQMLPETEDGTPTITDYPTLTDIQMDPPSAYMKLTGTYDENISDEDVYKELLKVMERDAKKLASENSSGQHFRYVETPLITAIRNGYLIEIQEPTVIANPGVLVGLNALLDRCASVTLTTGETITRHPDTVVVVTTNNNYAGCRDMNQSVISRMNMIIDLDEPDQTTMAERVLKVTGCTDKTVVTEMAASVHEISERCRETMINDGSCGVRELISWVQSYMVCGNVLEAAKYTVLSSVSGDPENRADILSSCLEQKYAA